MCLYHHHHFRIYRFSASVGEYSPILGCCKSTGLGSVFLFIKKFLTIEHVPRITDFCSCIYVLGCKLSVVRLCGSDFGITPVDDITVGITCAAFCFHIAHISFASSWYLFCLSVIIIIIIIITPCLPLVAESLHLFDVFRPLTVCVKTSITLRYSLLH